MSVLSLIFCYDALMNVKHYFSLQEVTVLFSCFIVISVLMESGLLLVCVPYIHILLKNVPSHQEVILECYFLRISIELCSVCRLLLVPILDPSAFSWKVVTGLKE